MKRCKNAAWVALSLGMCTALAGRASAETKRYQILTGGSYIYLPSQMGLGVPGGVPDKYELHFGIAGSFRLDFAPDLSTANFVDANIILTGNEAVQANPPNATPVTGARLGDFLESRTFVNVPSVALFSAYADSHFRTLTIRDWNSRVDLSGGYDSRPVDGDGLQFFNVTAALVPEPSTGLLALAGVAGLRRSRRSAMADGC